MDIVEIRESVKHLPAPLKLERIVGNYFYPVEIAEIVKQDIGKNSELVYVAGAINDTIYFAHKRNFDLSEWGPIFSHGTETHNLFSYQTIRKLTAREIAPNLPSIIAEKLND